MERRVGTLQLYLLFWFIAFWPIWIWYVKRLTDRSDEPWGLFALLTAVCLIVRSRHALPISGGIGRLPVLGLIVYSISFPFTLPLIRAIGAVMVIALSLSRLVYNKHLHLGLFGLLLLSLPILPSLQFLLGSPLRLFAAEMAAVLLRFYGYEVAAEGTLLRWNEQLIWVDAPCSGIRMLWMGLYCSYTLMTVFDLQGKRALVATATTLAFVLAGNIVRATVLFGLEAKIIHAPPQAHTVVGVLVFIIVCALIFATHVLLERGLKRRERLCESAARAPQLGVILASVIAAVIPFVSLPSSQALRAVHQVPPFLDSFEGAKLRQLPLSPREEQFLQTFPGTIGRFTDETREVIQRLVSAPTRKLHPSIDCFKGIGYRVDPITARRGSDGSLWGCFRASKQAETLKVCELITDMNGNSWSDVSSWYWATLLGRTEGPWRAITFAVPLATAHQLEGN